MTAFRRFVVAASLLGFVPLGAGVAPASAAGAAVDLAAEASVHPAPGAMPSRRLAVRHVSDWVDAVPVLPGTRFPLEANGSEVGRAAVTWRATGGSLAYGSTFAVWTAPLEPGAYTLVGRGFLAGRPVARTLKMLVTVPASRVRGGRLNGYPIGTYPRGFGFAATQVASRGDRGEDRYVVPGGFVQLDARTADVAVSDHYQLRDFQGKDAFVGGRKYLFLEPRLVEKLERLPGVLHRQGWRCARLAIMSGYRSPWLNRAIGNRTALSRHTYGDAADLIVQDHDGNGRVTRRDAEILLAAATQLDHQTDLTGGGAIYPPTGGHGWFVHTDTRGHVVRW